MSLSPTVSLPLDGDTLAVLFDLLGRWVEDEKLAVVRPNLAHEAEAWALNDLYSVLETLTDPSMVGGTEGARGRLMAYHGDLDYPV